ncbi:hypothetical protein [Cytobacillus purgationiresistens]|uniref:Uncharacterized protein n=1 Tax=Cytobacillus purgationiresistens TaxID=863449 RepID=A0ABU0ACZ4_9BACI|nr:hypothetical protein [Cytobacillus purgationiresistens]MDQ0268672.1 hypothetical protein [Cytobacillus purgationiresistens]
MNFILFEIDNPKKLKSLSKSKISFFKKDEDISLFHFNKMDDGLFHVVFNISDEYMVSTKKLGSQHHFSYSSLTNFFFDANSQTALIEYINKEYLDEVTKEIEKRTKSLIRKKNITNEQFLIIQHEFSGKIKKIEFTNSEEEYFELENVSNNFIKDNLNDITIDKIVILHENQYLSVSNDGKVSVDNSDQEYVIDFVKRFINEIT